MNTYSSQEKLMGLIRLALGWIFFWPFLDKLFGLGFATEVGKGWIAGNSPTFGFLSYGTQGPFSVFFQGLAGNMFVDWLFMAGLFCVGLALILGVFRRIAVCSGILIFILMWLAVLPPEHNPFLDDHIVYSLMLIALAHIPSDFLSFGRKWRELSFVKRHKIFR